ncbi:S1-C subfamily serine protease [Amycolatopsis bartoniae]|uniref:Serine protease n=1 Tax=Amycolatopsis bartoniae TaxID=941986 RepID=A0A8H9IYC5_9PSEU|nr:trypsin-like peptidase domain-containing protein [Amycolatopsis bartoniae]MBB2937265.1 S1-C subfamily serine protease [Amycolatopsis bartoniae]TVT07909.1 PDZ domain-containing protein [Amycolatopsis bartoniae]GHF77756.1 serine protease [Amycolatopsis bartoniae]
MSQPNTPEDQEPRLAPKPLDRPPVDAAQAAVFGRPRGVDGAFDKLYTPNGRGSDTIIAKPPAPESLAEAFGRPPGAEDVQLQRPADDNGNGSGKPGEAPLWSKTADPWRDPGAPAVLGSPALAADDAAKGDDERPRGALLSLPEVLFGRRVKPTALGLLGVVCLLIGAVGGFVGWWVASTGNSLTGSATIAEAEAGKERAPGSIADIAQRVSPAVISIEVKSGESGSVGSGVMIDAGGYAVTNNHVISLATTDPQATITAVFTDGTRTEAKVVGTDPKTDLAVIKVAVANPVVIQVGKSSDLEVGDSVIAVGSPLGLQNTVTAGIVSALHRPITAQGENGEPPVTYDAIQTDAPINRGNSGGALVDSTGALIGINSSIRTDSGESGQGGSIGIGFAIPADDAMRIAKVLISSGQVKHADIGINAASVSADTSEGAQVLNVADGGPAAKAGIAEGDVITKVGDRLVRNAAELTVAVRAHNVGDVVPVQLVRQGRPLVVDVTLGSD